MKQRSAFWDNYKGFLIVLVVFGHFIFNCATSITGSSVETIFTAIYLFHMPAFVFSSGFFSRSDSARSEKSIVRLVLYYLVFNGLMLLYYIVAFRQTPQLLEPYGSFWYLLSLICWRLSIKYLDKVPGITPIAVLMALVVGFWAEISNVLALSRTVVFFPFFLLGYRFDGEKFRQAMERRTKAMKALCALFALAVAAGLLLVAWKAPFTLDMLCGMPYETASHVIYRGLMLLSAVAGIAALMLIVPDRKIPVLTKLGKNSLLIYLLHRFVVLIFDHFVPAAMDRRLLLLLALAATAVTVLILGSDRLNKAIAGSLDRAAQAIVSEDRKKGRAVVALILIAALGVGSLPLCSSVKQLLQPQEETAVTIDAAKEVEDAVVLAYVGDLVLLKEQVASGYDEKAGSYDFSGMFQYAEAYLSGADYAIGVLEGPMAGGEKGYSTSDYDDGIEFYLNFPDEFAKDIKASGIDLVTTANNHVMDREADGALRTLDVLDAAGLAHTGTYRDETQRKETLVIEVQGIKIAVLSYTQLVNGYTTEEMARQYPHLTAIMPGEDSPCYDDLVKQIEADFERAKASGADLIMVLPHMGTQFSLKTDAFQKKWNKLFADLGADLILGDHSHCPQPLEYIGDTLVVNCPGNFADGFTGYNSDAKALVEIYLDGENKTVIGAGVIPMYTQEYEKGAYRAMPIYDVFADETLKSQVYSRDLERMQQVHRLVTETMLGQAVKIRDAQPRYYFIDGRYCP